MTADELRALADALEPMAKAPRFEDFNVPGFCAWVRACADAEPVAWLRPENRLREESTSQTRFSFGKSRPPIGTWQPLYARPAQAAAKPCWCHKCNEGRLVNGIPFAMTQMIVCPICGNKRCPHASDHALACTASNDSMAVSAAPQAEQYYCRDHGCSCNIGDPIPEPEPKRPQTCLWSRADDGTDMWETACGNAFTIIEGSPADNKMVYCCYCGRELKGEIGDSDADR